MINENQWDGDWRTRSFLILGKIFYNSNNIACYDTIILE